MLGPDALAVVRGLPIPHVDQRLHDHEPEPAAHAGGTQHGRFVVGVVHLESKADADEAARAADIDSTIVRPGALTDDDPSGSVRIADSTGRGQISRADIAAVLAALIVSGRGRNTTFELIAGDTPIADAVGAPLLGAVVASGVKLRGIGADIERVKA